jgi:hypothetical protein
MTKVCKNCQQEKNISEFYNKGSRKRGQCKDCLNQKHYVYMKQRRLEL